jgi:hypothetical protein
LESANIPKQGTILDAQAVNLGKEGNRLDLEAVNIPKQGDILDLQGEQINYTNLQIVEKTRADTYNVDQMLPSQKAILDQKKITEEAQTKSVTTQGTVTGSIGARNDLLTAQKEGFYRDAEQKAMRALSEVWGLAIGSSLDGTEIPDAVGKAEISDALEQVRAGANIPYTP